MFIYNMKYNNINVCVYIYVNSFKIYTVCVCVCVYIYIINKHSTHIYYANKNFYFGCD